MFSRLFGSCIDNTLPIKRDSILKKAERLITVAAMGKDKKSKQSKSSSSSGSSSKSNLVKVDPETVRFTHSKIRPYFSGCGRKVLDTLADIEEGRMKLEQLPQITVIMGADGHVFSLNNRRLYVLKALRSRGLLPDNSIGVRTKEALPRELARYTVDRCSLTATIMRERPKEDEAQQGKPDEVGSDDDNDSEDDGNGNGYSGGGGGGAEA